MMWRVLAVIAVLGMSIARGAVADDIGDVSDPQGIVEQSADQFAEAFNRRDANEIAQLFTPEAEYIDAAGMIFHGRAAIAGEFAAVLELSPPGAMAIELISIRPIAEGVLVEDGVSSFVPEEEGAISHTRYTATHVRQKDGAWQIASVRELEAAKMTPHDRLQSLAWLVGSWHEDVAGSVISTEWKWSENGNFLISEFSVRQAADSQWSGTHRIGWDAGRKQFRSWIFESGGGSLTGWWRGGEDGSWSVSLSGIDTQGTPRSSVMTYQRDGENAIAVTQGQRIVDGQMLPGSVHRVVRQPPQVKQSANQP
ncbi:MAG: nuclear transport factor 2 family protein [Pirellulaceae bacterium]